MIHVHLYSIYAGMIIFEDSEYCLILCSSVDTVYHPLDSYVLHGTAWGRGTVGQFVVL